MTVELRRAPMSMAGGEETCQYSFMWSRGRRSWPAFIQPENMPPIERDADWDFAWYEVAKVNGVWTGLRRMTKQYGGATWTPDAPDHAATGGAAPLPVRHHSTPGRTRGPGEEG
jgi:hypothetical protein